MTWTTLRFAVRQTIGEIRLNPWNHTVTVITVALAVLIFSAFLTLYHNASLLLVRWRAAQEVTVYLQKGISDQEQQNILNHIKTQDGVIQAQWVSEEEALSQFKAELGPQGSLLEGLSTNPLPASVEFFVDENVIRNLWEMEALLVDIRALDGVEEIQSSQDWMNRLAPLKEGLAMLSVMLGGGLLVAVVFIISNTIKLTVYSREEEIEIMRLVGATDATIRAPFLIEGVIQGGAGAGLALLILTLGYELAAPVWNSNLKALFLGMRVSFLPWQWIGGLVVGGLIIGGLGSFLSLSRFLRT
jgi:cell division transport system permease protein